ncbi:hypothetical protein DITRI_Ditri01bG0015300 [Diplodiscus trichospermus]
MAILSKTLDGDDMKQLTITQAFSTEPLPSAAAGAMKVKDEQGFLYTFQYKVKSRNKRVLSGHHWVQFLENNGIRVGDRIAIHNNDSWCSAADYKIEVLRCGY